MLILLPVKDECLCKQEEAQQWALIEFENGERKVSYHGDRDSIDEWIDAVVLIDESEYYWPFIEENMMVLTAPTQRTVDEVMEAFIFKELREVSF